MKLVGAVVDAAVDAVADTKVDARSVARITRTVIEMIIEMVFKIGEMLGCDIAVIKSVDGILLTLLDFMVLGSLILELLS